MDQPPERPHPSYQRLSRYDAPGLVWLLQGREVVALTETTELRVPYFATIGNNSQTLQYQAGKRFAEYLDQGLIPLVLHLADHDPNGIDMTRDNIERLALYARQEVEVRASRSIGIRCGNTIRRRAS